MHTGPWAEDRHQVSDALAAAVKSCAPRFTEVPGLAERLAKSTYTSVRIALAQVLPKSEVSLLRALAQDANRDVREAANKRLDASLRSDAFPISTEGHDESVLAKARHILELPTHQYGKHQPEAVLAIRPLSDALATAVWERLLLAGHVGGAQFWPWLAALLERPGGEHALVRLLTEWSRTDDSFFVAYSFEKIGKLSVAACNRTVDALLLAIRDAPKEGYLRSQMAQCTSRLVTPRYDKMKLLEGVLGVPIHEAAETLPDHHYPSYELAKPLTLAPVRGPLREVLIGALRDGKRGRWQHVPHAVWVRLGADPSIREKTIQSIETAAADKRGELVATLLQHRIPELDGTEAKLVESLYVNPELRPALIRTTKAGKVLARRSLLKGELAMDAVAEFTLCGIERKDPESRQSDRLWVAVRRARDAALANAFDIDLCALIRPGETFEPSDLALAQRAYEKLLANEPMEGDYLRFINALANVKAAESQAMLDTLAEKSEVEGLKDVIASYRCR